LDKQVEIDGERRAIDQVAEVARHFARVVISDKAIDRVTEGRKSIERIVQSHRTVYGINTGSPGLSSALMVTQYTAASLVSQNRFLASPASLDNAIVSAGQEDHASLGAIAALKTREVLDNSLKVLAIELLCAIQATDLLGARKEELGNGTRRAYEEVRKITKKGDSDRPLFPDFEKLAGALKAEVFSSVLK
jgi:histidine ammonia-lyase